MSDQYRQAHVAGIPTSIKDGGYGLKRCRLEGVRLTSYCPSCGAGVTKDMGNGRGDYLSFPAINEPIEVHFYHECPLEDGGWGDAEWDVQIVLRVSVEAVICKEAP